jgi:hypothetical protein
MKNQKSTPHQQAALITKLIKQKFGMHWDFNLTLAKFDNDASKAVKEYANAYASFCCLNKREKQFICFAFGHTYAAANFEK